MEPQTPTYYGYEFPTWKEARVSPSFIQTKTVAQFKNKWALTIEQLQMALSAQTPDGFQGPSYQTVHSWINGKATPPAAVFSLLQVIDNEWSHLLYFWKRQGDKYINQVYNNGDYYRPRDQVFIERVLNYYRKGKLDPNKIRVNRKIVDFV